MGRTDPELPNPQLRTSNTAHISSFTIITVRQERVDHRHLLNGVQPARYSARYAQRYHAFHSMDMVYELAKPCRYSDPSRGDQEHPMASDDR